jgi:hypothetical protein
MPDFEQTNRTGIAFLTRTVTLLSCYPLALLPCCPVVLLSCCPGNQPRSNRDMATIYTIGHSTHPASEFIDLLKLHRIHRIVDIRTVPGSARYPHFNRERLGPFLRQHHFTYEHEPALGGLRKPHKESVNTGWRNASFRGYADYMSTTEFQDALERLIHSLGGDSRGSGNAGKPRDPAAETPVTPVTSTSTIPARSTRSTASASASASATCLMCAEAVPWRCHRSLIADALVVRGHEVRHIINRQPARPHRLNPMATVDGTRLVYPRQGEKAETSVPTGAAQPRKRKRSSSL